MAMWNPWVGCHRNSEGCLNCYIFQGNEKRNIDTNNIRKTKDFLKPTTRDKNGKYKLKSGSKVFVCFSSDYFIEEADEWRNECWQMIKERNDLDFIFLTKRIERFHDCIPKDWGNGYDNVTIGCSVSNQIDVDKKIALLANLPIKHKNIILQPQIDECDIEMYLDDIELVIVGGEYGKKARPLNYNWVLSIRDQCIRNNVNFEFRQCGTYFIKNNKQYTLIYRELSSQAKKANINYQSK